MEEGLEEGQEMCQKLCLVTLFLLRGNVRDGAVVGKIPGWGNTGDIRERGGGEKGYGNEKVWRGGAKKKLAACPCCGV